VKQLVIMRWRVSDPASRY